MSLETLTYSVYCQTALSAIVAFFALTKFKSREMYIKLIGVAFLLGFIANTSAFLLLKTGHKYLMNIPASLYDLMVTAVISLLYYHALKKRYGKWFLSIAICSLSLGIVNLLFLQKYSINSYTRFIDSFIVISYCIVYFYRLMVGLPSVHLQRMPMFWFNSAFLIYYAGVLILFVFTSYIINVLKDNFIAYLFFHNCLSICAHFLVLIGLYYNLSTLKKSTAKV